MASYRSYRMSWYATFSATALGEDAGPDAPPTDQAAADLRAGLVAYVANWRKAFGEDFTADELEIITDAAVNGLREAVTT